MASASIEKEKRLAAARKARQLAARAAQRQQHTIIALGAAYGLGFAEKRAFALPTIPGVAPEVLYGVLGLVGAWWLRNVQAKRIAQSLGDGLLSVALYKAGRYDFGRLFRVGPRGGAAAGYY